MRDEVVEVTRAERAASNGADTAPPLRAVEEPGHEIPPDIDADVDSPVFVIGTGRCGTTALMDLIAYHGEFTWPSQYTARWPRRPQLAALSRIVELPPFTSRWRFTRYVPKHAENYSEWDERFPGFAEPFRDLVASDVTPLVKERIRASVRDLTRFQGKPRYITKYTGWSRIGFVKEIFPDAKFIHIVRDGRAVAYSYTTMPWWDGWAGAERSRWALPELMLRELERHDRSFVALAALQWRMLIDDISQASATLPDDDVLLLRYEDMVRDPIATARRGISFAGADPHDRRFEAHLDRAARRIVDPDSRPSPPPWKRNLSPAQIEMVNELCAEQLRRFDYASP